MWVPGRVFLDLALVGSHVGLLGRRGGPVERLDAGDAKAGGARAEHGCSRVIGAKGVTALDCAH
jgi:hypothetical protein